MSNTLAELFVARMQYVLKKGIKWQPQHDAVKLEGIGLKKARARRMFVDIGGSKWVYYFSDGSQAGVISTVLNKEVWVIET